MYIPTFQDYTIDFDFISIFTTSLQILRLRIHLISNKGLKLQKLKEKDDYKYKKN